MLDLLGIALSNQHIKFCRLDGSMSGTARDACIKQFNNDPKTTVILVSLMAGGVGYVILNCLREEWNLILLFRLKPQSHGRFASTLDGTSLESHD